MSTQPIQGIHHITALASNPQRNVNFYTQILGQRLVKRTVNFDDPGTYHLYYGDNVGSPGTIMTFFPWPHARRGTVGNGEVAATAYAIAPDALGYWQERLTAHGITVFAPQTRFGATVLPFLDPDGMVLELVTEEEGVGLPHWENSSVPRDHALRGFAGVTIYADSARQSGALLGKTFGYNEMGREGDRIRYRGAVPDGVAQVIDFLERPGQPVGRMGAGSVHHVAFRTKDDAEQLAWQQTIAHVGLGVTEVKDRQYFHSIYFREPSGVLYEIATDPPGFTTDETVTELGSALKLPPWLEVHRSVIEQRLPSLHVAEHCHGEGN